MKLNSWLSRLLSLIADRVAGERFDITREWSQVPYLTRWTLVGTRSSHNALIGFQSKLASAADGRAIFLHRFQRSDADEPHDHPWPFVSIILFGGYYEETPANGWRDGKGPMKRRWYWPGSILVRPARWIHRVVIPEGCEAWSLILRGRKERSWGFWCSNIGFIPWRQHLANAEKTGKGCGA